MKKLVQGGFVDPKQAEVKPLLEGEWMIPEPLYLKNKALYKGSFIAPKNWIEELIVEDVIADLKLRAENTFWKNGVGHVPDLQRERELLIFGPRVSRVRARFRALRRRWHIQIGMAEIAARREKERAALQAKYERKATFFVVGMSATLTFIVLIVFRHFGLI